MPPIHAANPRRVVVWGSDSAESRVGNVDAVLNPSPLHVHHNENKRACHWEFLRNDVCNRLCHTLFRGVPISDIDRSR